MTNLFGTDGIRGRVSLDECDDEEALSRLVEDRLFTPQLMKLLGEALGRCLPEVGEGSQVIIGWDDRPHNQTLAAWLTLGFHASNCEVIHVGCASTPMLHYAVLETQSRLGCMITASHNPVDDSGLKVFDSQGRKSMPMYEMLVSETAYSLSQEDREIDAVDRKAWMVPDSMHTVEHEHWLNRRVKLIQQLFESNLLELNHFHLDSSKGHATQWLAKWLQEQGLSVEEVSHEAVAMNDGCGAGELSPGQSWTWEEVGKSGHLLIDSLSAQGHDGILGAALDGDGDRCLLVRETKSGVEVVDGDDIADAMLRACPRSWKVAASIESNLKLLSSVKENAEMEGFETAVGDRWLSHALSPYLPKQEQQPLLFGIEDSGHLVLPSPHPHNDQHWSLVGDGAMTLVLALLAFQNVKNGSMQKGWKKRLSVKNPNRWMWDGKNELSDIVESMVRTHLELAGDVTNWSRTGLEGESNLMLIQCQFNGIDVSFGLRNSGTQAKTSVSLRFSEPEPGFDAMLMMRSVQNLLLRTFNPVAH
ncbi:MAG: hypothetical protein VXW14_03550 [Candidatus Thermoplasmatota archaeon]|nr:hypothetical protein [Candidatus Thermoplasmatota archaeon]MEC7253673.1 hypothetical protein [Candidatus Thermoplasmatota archaeon]